MYLSVVNIGRNDNHGGDYLSRLQRSVNSLSLAEDTEYVFVDWGSEGAGMEDAIRWPIPTRIIKVPRSVINQIENPDSVFLVPHALNVGIRRAQGRFILTTGSDTVFSLGIVGFFNKQELDPSAYYRVNLIRKNASGETTATHYTSPGIPHYGAAGDFILMSRQSYQEIHGWPELGIYNSVDGMTVHLAYSAGLKEVVLPYEVSHLEHGCSDFSQVVVKWDDFNPRAVKNGDNWGFPGVEFEEIRRGYGR
jgi:hypothetical protein